MKKLALIVIAFVSMSGYSATLPGNECAAPGNYVEGMLLTSIKNDLGIDLTRIQYDKTIMEVISIHPVSEVFARKLAIADSMVNPGISADELYGIYHSHHAVTVTAKYTFTDLNNKRDQFISSAIANDDECSVKYNGYLTLSREF